MNYEFLPSEIKLLSIFFFKLKIWDEGVVIFFEVKPRIFFFYTFLRVSVRKIHIVKNKTKLHPTELNKIYDDTNKK